MYIKTLISNLIMGIDSNREITDSSVVQRKNDLLYSEIQDEIVALNINTSEYIGFNSVGSRIWRILEHPVGFPELLNRIVQEFDVNSAQARKDVIHFLQKLYEKKLITVK